MGIAPQGKNGSYLSPSLKSGYLWPRHRRLLRLFAAGMSAMEISGITGYSPGQLSRIQGSPHFQLELENLMERADEVAVDMREDLLKMGQRSVEVLDEDLNIEPTDPRTRALRQKAAMDILDRIGARKDAGRALGGGVHFHQHLHEAKKLSDEELRDEVFDIVKGGFND